MRRIKIIIAYDGTDFHGWQTQPGLPTIQGSLEDIVSGIEGEPVQAHPEELNLLANAAPTVVSVHVPRRTDPPWVCWRLCYLVDRSLMLSVL